MELAIDMECRECGWLFQRSLRHMPHGKTVKCPFCRGSALDVKGDFLIEVQKTHDVFDQAIPVKLNSLSTKR
ncbi:MAG: hypothetical protein HYS21_00700 [Deltaproteobacteria bacterium]|nr:hypothetical protein [Deltaproteobacteria bacterium]